MILKTTNYSQFTILNGNRPLDIAHVKRIMESITNRNLLAENPIVVNNFLCVIDGQHRLEAAKRLGIPIFYIVINHGSLEDVWLLNTSQKNWSLLDYVNSYISRGYVDYRTLKDFSLRYDLPLGISAFLLANKKFDTESDSIKKGKFKVISIELAEKYANYVIFLRNYTSKNLSRSRNFLMSAINLCRINGLNLKKLARKIESRKIEIPKLTSEQEYLRFYEKIYNRNNREPIRFY